MKSLIVNTSQKYEIIIRHGGLNQAGEYIREITKAQRALIVSDSNIAPLYADVLKDSLKKSGFLTSVFVFEAGEQSKTLSTVEKIYTHLAENRFTRSDIVVALGGGVTGDMAGYASATYMRGIDFVNIPTSLLSQVDSSVGGKTGVDLPSGKNLVGAFWQPKLVLIDPDTLSTLPAHFISDGMGEVIKYGCIKSESLFEICNAEIQDFDDIIYKCVDIKRQIVENDERERGERMLLNFGHTLGHGLEKLHNYSGLSHGAAVGIGMVMMAQAGEKAGLTKQGTAEKIKDILAKNNLPIESDFSKSDIAAAALGDKKSSGDEINLVLLSKIGESFIYKIKQSELSQFIS